MAVLVSPEVLMRGILVALIQFSVLFLLQIAVWRIFKPRKAMLALFFIYLFLPILIGFLARQSLPAHVLYFGLACAWILTFPALQAQSPSLALLLFLEQSGKQNGASLAEILTSQNKETLVIARMEDLKNDGLMYQDSQGSLKIGPLAKVLAIFFIFWRRLLRIEGNNG
jgi:hypothetical protein